MRRSFICASLMLVASCGGAVADETCATARMAGIRGTTAAARSFFLLEYDGDDCAQDAASVDAAVRKEAFRQARCVADMVYFEGRGTPFEDRMKLVSVMANRIIAGHRGVRSFCEAFNSPGQFPDSVERASRPERAEGDAWREAIALADRVLFDGFAITTDANHFWSGDRAQPDACKRHPKWARGLKLLECTGPRRFRFARGR